MNSGDFTQRAFSLLNVNLVRWEMNKTRTLFFPAIFSLKHNFPFILSGLFFPFLKLIFELNLKKYLSAFINLHTLDIK